MDFICVDEYFSLTCKTMNVGLLIVLAFSLNIAFGLHHNRSTKVRRKSFATVVFSKNQVGNRNKTSCEWLRNLKHQSKLCWKRRGLAGVLANARHLAISSCEEQFRYSQWNCTHRNKFFKKFYRETALMYSLSTSALMYSVARACREGTLAGCKCGEHGKSTNSSDIHWGDCADNTNFAKSFTKKFLQLRKKSDIYGRMIRYNSEIGIKVILHNVEVVCRCHGVSGSCSVKICFKKMRPFQTISQQLKNYYHNAIQLSPTNSINSLKEMKNNRSNRKKLVYYDASPNFCPSTVGRRCNDTDNCATLCCGRGHFVDTIEVLTYCNCRWPNNSLQLNCETCSTDETIFRCK